jgi:hypothetical protein
MKSIMQRIVRAMQWAGWNVRLIVRAYLGIIDYGIFCYISQAGWVIYDTYAGIIEFYDSEVGTVERVVPTYVTRFAPGGGIMAHGDEVMRGDSPEQVWKLWQRNLRANLLEGYTVILFKLLREGRSWRLTADEEEFGRFDSMIDAYLVGRAIINKLQGDGAANGMHDQE